MIANLLQSYWTKFLYIGLSGVSGSVPLLAGIFLAIHV